MADHTSHAKIEVDVNDRDALARLQAIRREFHDTMAAIDHEQATATIDGDIKPLKSAAADARAEVKKLEGLHAEIEMGIRDGDLEEVAAEIKAAKREVKSLDGMVAEIEIETRGAKEAIAEQEAVRKATEKRIKTIQDFNRKEAALQSKLHRENLARVNKEARVRESLAKQRYREEQAEERAERLRQREIDEVPRLEMAYSRLSDKMEQYAAARKKARGNDKSLFNIGRAEQATANEMDRLAKEVRRRVGRDPIHFQMVPDIGERAGRRARESFISHFLRKGTATGAFLGAGAEMGEHMGRGMIRSFRRTTDRGMKTAVRDVSRTAFLSVADASMGVLSKVGRGLSGLSDMTVRLGPFTTSIKGLIVGLTVLGPILVDVVAALGSLVSIAGAAALGVGALGAGLIGGAIPAFLGMGLVIKSVVGDFQKVQKAQKAYDDAVSKNGVNSKQAAKKIEEMRHVMGGVSKDTAQTFTQFKDLQPQFRKLTAPARGSVFTALAQGIKTAQSLMPQFARRTNDAMSVAEHATTRWQKGLRSSAGKQAINEMMGNFNRFLGPVLNGLGSLAGYLGRIGQIASRSLPKLGQEFQDWAKGINSVSTGKLEGQVHKLIDEAKDVGRFFMAAGRLIKTFFAGGVDAGDSFVNTMTDAMDRWTGFLQTTEGQKGLHDFFSQGVKGAQALWSLLAPIAGSFVRWAEVLSPTSRLIFQISGAISGFVTKILSLTALRGPITGLVTTLGLLWGVGKISTAVAAVSAFTRALLGLAGAEKAVAEGGALMKGASLLGGLRAGGAAKTAVVGEQLAMDVAAASAGTGAVRGAEQAGKSAAKFGLLRTAVMGVGTAFGATSLAGSALATGGLAIVAGAAAYGAYKLLTMKSASEKLHDKLKNLDNVTQNYRDTSHALLGVTNAAGQSMHDYRASVGQVAGLKKHLNNLERDGKKNTAEYRDTLDRLNGALNERAQHYRDNRKLMVEASKLEQAHTEQSNKLAKAHDLESEAGKRLADKRQRLYDLGMRGKQIDAQTTAEQKDLADARARVAAAEAAEAAAARAAIVGQMNYQRGLRGMIPLAGRAATALANLAKRAPNMSQKISLKYADPKDAGNVAKRASAALKSGVSSKLVTKIIADSSSAEQAIRRINAAQMKQKIVNIVEHGGKDAIAILEKIAGRKLTPHELRIVQKGGHDALALLGRLTRTKIGNKTFQTILHDLATGKIRTLKGLIDSLRNKTVTLTTREVHEIIRKTKKVPNVYAAGRSAGSSETALVGEGRRHEYVADGRTGEVFKTSGPTFMALSPSQAVIPTEPRYRERGRGIFAEIARDLGIDAFAGGKHATKHHKKKAKPARDFGHSMPNHHKTNPNASKRRHLPVPEVWKKGAAADDAASALASYIGQREGRIKTLEAQINAKETAYKRTTAGKNGKRQRKHLREDTEKLRDKRDIAKFGDKHGSGNAKLSLSALQSRMSDYNKVKDRLAILESGINKDASDMGTYSTQYEHGDDGAMKRWQSARTDRTGLLKEARDLLAAAAKAATDPKTKAALTAEAAAKNDDFTSSVAEPDPDRADVPLTEAQQKTLDNIGIFGGPGEQADASAALLAVLGRDTALASLNNVDDDPATLYTNEHTDSLKDDQQAAQATVDFWQGILDRVNVPGADPAQVQNAAENLGTAKDALKGLSDEINAPPATTFAQQQMSLGTSREDLYRSFGSNFSLASNMGMMDDRGRGGRDGGSSPFPLAPGYQWGAPGANQSPVAGGVVFNQTFQQMPDPHTWSQGVAFELQAI